MKTATIFVVLLSFLLIMDCTGFRDDRRRRRSESLQFTYNIDEE